jgi:hypothetical protein
MVGDRQNACIAINLAIFSTKSYQSLSALYQMHDKEDP